MTIAEAVNRLTALCEYFELHGEWPGNRSDSSDVADLRAVLAERERLQATVTADGEHSWALAMERDAAMRRVEAAESEAQQLRTRLDQIGEVREEWASDAPGCFMTLPGFTEENARYIVDSVRKHGGIATVKTRLAGQWRDVGTEATP